MIGFRIIIFKQNGLKGASLSARRASGVLAMSWCLTLTGNMATVHLHLHDADIGAMAHGDLSHQVCHPVLDADLVAGEQWTHAVHVATLTSRSERVQIVYISHRAVLAPQPLGAVHRQRAYCEQNVCHLYSNGPRL